MDQKFGHLSFCLIYIDDILIASKDVSQHLKDLLKFFETTEKGVILSKKKMELFKTKIDFLGLTIDKGKVELQPHILKKILEMPDKLETKRELQQFVGLVNYGRKFIKNLSSLAGPLYSKLGKNGQRFFNQEDIKLVQKIKEEVKKIQPLKLPKETDYLILETDGSVLGWGAVLTCKPNKYSPESETELVGYASGNFPESAKTASSIDLVIQAIQHALNKFKLYLQKEITIRTDCVAIVSWLNSDHTNKRTSIRWMKFLDVLTAGGYKPAFEHIKGKNNFIADILSRKIYAGSKPGLPASEK